MVGCGGALGLGLAPGLGLGPLGVSLEAGPAKAERRRHPVAEWGAWRRAAALRVCVGALPGQ